jgi:NTE family protein
LPATGLLLTGGGARAAYQVGVLEAIAQLRRDAALACGTDDFDATVRRIAEVWRDFRTDQVYHADALGMLDAMGRMRLLLGVGQLIAKWLRVRPRSLLDNRPLAGLLQRLVPLDRMPALMAGGHLQALAVTASSYSSGEHFTFFETARPTEPWVRSQRIAVASSVTHDHLMASSAIPFVFPATGLTVHGHTEYFGDGSMRQSAPISPAIHLGAERVLVIGAGRLHEPPADPGPNTMTGYPTLAQIAGHAMSSIFLDALAADIERLRRINRTLTLIPSALRAQSHLRPVELLVIAPSQRIDVIAARHVGALPGAVRRLFGVRAGGAGNDIKGAAFASYLLFDSAFTGELMALGRADTQRQQDEVRRFFGWAAAAP